MPKYETIENHIERRTYIQGKFKGKFIGYFEPIKSDFKHENFYDLEVISGEIKTTKKKSNIRHWETGEPEKFQNIQKFLTKLPENLPLEITYENGETKTYNVNLNDKKLSNYKLSSQVYENNKVFGDISGSISGYLKHFDIEYVVVEINTKIAIPANLKNHLKRFKITLLKSEIKYIIPIKIAIGKIIFHPNIRSGIMIIPATMI